MRVLNFAGFICCASLLGYAYILQFFAELDPCPLCIFQRLVFFVLGLIFLLAALHRPKTTGAWVYGTLLGISSAVGIAIAWRHIWLQQLPEDKVPECGPGLEYMLEVFSLGETLEMVFTGSGECAKVSWAFLGLSIPTWSLIWFVILGIVGVVNNFRLKQHSSGRF